MKTRIAWIDTYRGILIMLVVLNHQSLSTSVINESLLSVRMPAFFFISGFLLSDRYSEFGGFTSRRFFQLIVPYFIFFTLNWLFWVVALRGDETNIFAPLWAMLYGCVNTGGGAQNINAAPLWFITTLFVAEMIFFFVKRFFKTTRNMLFSLAMLGVLGYLGSMVLPIRFPWNIEIALTATVFYGFGYLVKRENLLDLLPDRKDPKLMLLFIFSFFGALFLSLQTHPIYDLNNLGAHVILTYESAFLGIIALMTLAKGIDKNPMLEYLGKNTYIILAFHLSALYLLHGLIKRLGFDFAATQYSDIWGFVYFVSSFVLLVPLITLINRFAPFILGRDLK